MMMRCIRKYFFVKQIPCKLSSASFPQVVGCTLLVCAEAHKNNKPNIARMMMTVVLPKEPVRGACVVCMKRERERARDLDRLRERAHKKSERPRRQMANCKERERKAHRPFGSTAKGLLLDSIGATSTSAMDGCHVHVERNKRGRRRTCSKKSLIFTLKLDD